jgi:hypothetical protein
MPKKCFVPGCKTVYLSNGSKEAELAVQGKPTSIFLVPKDYTTRRQWPDTVAGLRLYARVKKCEEFGETADVLEAWQRLVAIMNVRGPGQDRRWNDKYRCVLRPGAFPGTFDQQSEANLRFLLEMGDIFKGMAEAGKQRIGDKGSR